MQLDVLTPLLLTLKVAAVATIGAGLAGVLAAWGLAGRRFPGRDWLDAALTLPLVLPPTVLGYYLLTAFGRRGPIGAWLMETFGLTLMFTWQGAALAAAVVAFPLVFKSALAALEGVDRRLADAARILGSGEVAVFLRVSLPLAARGVTAGAMLAFARAMGEFGATLMIAGNIPGRTQTLALAVYSASQAGDDETANLLVGVASLTAAAILVIATKLVKRSRAEAA